MSPRYAYGCNELVFNPLYKWYKGPFTRIFMKFLWSNIKITSKITILAYIGTCEHKKPFISYFQFAIHSYGLLPRKSDFLIIDYAIAHPGKSSSAWPSSSTC